MEKKLRMNGKRLNQSIFIYYMTTWQNWHIQIVVVKQYHNDCIMGKDCLEQGYASMQYNAHNRVGAFVGHYIGDDIGENVELEVCDCIIILPCQHDY